jgi:hypothetical protein
MPADVPTLAESFTADQLLLAVDALMPRGECRYSLTSETWESEGVGIPSEVP